MDAIYIIELRSATAALVQSAEGGTRSIYMAGLRPIWHTDYISHRPFTCPAWHSQGCEYDLIGYRSAPWGRLLRGPTYTGDGKLQEG